METHTITAAGREFFLDVKQNGFQGWVAQVRDYEDVFTAFIRFGGAGYIVLDQDEQQFGEVTGNDSAAALSLIFGRFHASIEDVLAEDAEDEVADAQDDAERIAGRLAIQLGEDWTEAGVVFGGRFSFTHNGGARAVIIITADAVTVELEPGTRGQVEHVSLDRDRATPSRVARVIDAML